MSYRIAANNASELLKRMGWGAAWRLNTDGVSDGYNLQCVTAPHLIPNDELAEVSDDLYKVCDLIDHHIQAVRNSIDPNHLSREQGLLDQIEALNKTVLEQKAANAELRQLIKELKVSG